MYSIISNPDIDSDIKNMVKKAKLAIRETLNQLTNHFLKNFLKENGGGLVFFWCYRLVEQS